MSGFAKGVKVVFKETERTELFDAFDRLTGWAIELAQWELKPERESWQNYMASLGIAAVRTCVSIGHLVRIDSTEGVPMLARELYQLATRFVDCIDRKNDAFLSGLKKELAQYATIESEQLIAKTCVINVSESKARVQSLLDEFNPMRSPVLKEIESGKNLSHGDKERYQQLCLGGHNRPNALLEKYGYHWSTNQMTPFESESREQIEGYLALAARPVFYMLERYFLSEFFPEQDRQHHLGLLASYRKAFENHPTWNSTPQ